MPFPILIALRYLWSKRSEAFISIISGISVLGVAVGVAVLIIVMGVMTGFQRELRSKILNTDSHITIRSISGKIENWQKLKEEVRNTSGISSVSAFTHNQALLRVRDNSSGLLIRGIETDSQAEKQLSAFMGRRGDEAKILEKDFPLSGEEGKLPAIVVGRGLARQLGIFVGMPVSLLSPQVTSSPFGLMPRFRRFAVAGLYSSGLVEYESGLAYMGLTQAQEFFRMGEAVSGFEVRVNDADAAPLIAGELVSKLRPFDSGIYAQDWTESNRPLWEAMKLEKRVYFIVLLLIIVMASFSIIATLVMVVLEKRRDVAILMTMGASSLEIGWVFILQGSIIGFVGVLSGVVLGVGGALSLREYKFPLDERVFQMSSLPVELDPINIAAVAFSAFLICTLATIYPARRASSILPSEVLRHD